MAGKKRNSGAKRASLGKKRAPVAPVPLKSPIPPIFPILPLNPSVFDDYFEDDDDLLLSAVVYTDINI